MWAIEPGMRREKVVKLLKFYPEIDGEIKARKNVLNDLEEYYDTSAGMNYGGTPGSRKSTVSTTERAALNVPYYAREQIERCKKEITELQAVKVEILKEVSRLKLKQKNVIFGFYLHGMKWEQVANGMHYSERQCKNIRDEAITKLLQGFAKNKVLITFQISE